jgi:hypothetical protein
MSQPVKGIAAELVRVTVGFVGYWVAGRAAVRTERAFQAKFNKYLIRRRGYKRSIVAIAREILRVVFAILRKGEPRKDITVDYAARMVKNNAPR